MKTRVESRKILKRNQILHLIRRSPVPLSRFDIKKLTEFSMTTVSNNISGLIQDGLVKEDICTEKGRTGRKPIWLSLSAEGGYLVGVEFNISSIHYAVLDFCCHTVYMGSDTVPEGIGASALMELVYSRTEACLDFLTGRGICRDRVLGIGLGIPGYLDAEAGIAIASPHIPDWRNIHVVELMEERFGIRCHIGNNVGVMGLCFKWIGEYREDTDFLLVSIRTGVRCIPVLGNEPYTGRVSTSGEIGHLRIPGGKRRCDCGRTGCLNSEISDPALCSILEEGIPDGRFRSIRDAAVSAGSRPSVSLLVQACRDNDPEALGLLVQCARHMGYAAAAAANLFAPQKIILSGELVKSGDLFMDALKEAAAEYCLPAIYDNMQILASPYGDNIGALGAAVLTLEKDYNPMPVNTL